ncbi:MAG: hypothetical protein KGZ80_05360 [Methylomonas sp.]|nr:hypothetical protein [Methylomonas sp.]PPD20236.1 MAG: hypothetical protein CTY23_09570 [Methylomonas sp.]PPD24005.1 MAG: hypothetical protein CTY22_11570 [Methylomonas sp.]PPD32280.1 MAG: hypothetical protein CTY21_11560 [Methylomonas sp.]PPD40346.1 MAG: hypothetical protein CTY17_06520 [Methylomonas sp.]
MSDINETADETISDDSATESPKHYLGLEEGIFILMVVLSLTGISVTNFSVHDGYGYWLFMVFVFGLVSIVVSWLQSRTNDNDFSIIIKQQGLHWFHTLVIVAAASLLNKSGQLSEIAATLVVLLILALATMLDGFRIGWQFSLLGFFLASCALIIAYVQPFMWYCIGLAILVIAATLLWARWMPTLQPPHDD